jgi:glycerol-3-phosphate dehydrogenase
VWHRHFPETPDKAQVESDELVSWITELNTVYPALQLSMDEVSFANCGLVPFGETATEHELSFGKESRLIDHREAHGVGGLVSLVGIRFTTARADARRALDLLFRQWPQGPSVASARERSLQAALPGGEIEDFNRFRSEAQRDAPHTVSKESLEGLLRNFGTQYRAIIATGDSNVVTGTDTLMAEVDYAVNNELATRVDDVVMRRTNLAAGRHPGSVALHSVADRMATLLGWSSVRAAEEVRIAQDNLRKHRAQEATTVSVPHEAHRNKERVSA